MALIYVRSGAASPTSPYTTWATAAATLQDAINNATPTNADTIYLAPDHAESVGSAQIWACPLTPGLRILCAASNTTTPPIALATTATLSTTGNFAQTMTGFAYVYGLNFNAGTTGNPIQSFGTTASANAAGLILEQCGLAILSTGSTGIMQVGSTYSGGLGAGNSVKLIDCTLRFGAVGQLLRIYSGNIEFVRLAFHASSSIPTTVFQLGPTTGVPQFTEFRGCDLTGKAYTNLFTVNGFQGASRTTLRNCLFASGSNLYTGTLIIPGGHLFRLHDCSATSPDINFAEHSAGGIVSQETVVKCTDGAESSNSTTYSIKLAGSIYATELYPLRTPEISIWNNIIDVPINITMEILRDSVTELQNDKMWMEVAYPNADDTSMYGYATDGRATQIESATDQSPSVVAWTTTGITNVMKQKLEVTITASKRGFINVRGCLAMNTTVYVDTPTIAE